MNSSLLTYIQENPYQWEISDIFIDDMIWINGKSNLVIPDYRKAQNWEFSYACEWSKKKVKYILDISFDATESMAALFIKNHRYLNRLTYLKEASILLLSLSQEIDDDLSCDYFDFPDARDFFSRRILESLFLEDSSIAYKFLDDISLSIKKHFWDATLLDFIL